MVLRAISSVVVILAACAASNVGRQFDDEAELASAFGDCAVVGRFDVGFPARIMSIEHGSGRLRFEHRGTSHVYTFGEGADLRAITVEHAGGRGVIVLRANEQS